MSKIFGGIGSFVTSFAILTGLQSDNIWINLGVSLLSAVLWAIISIGTKIITHYLEKKNIITSEQKKNIDDTADDLADDGKINKSNKGDK